MATFGNSERFVAEMEGTLRFEVDARHVRQLGRELVADRITALSELIKNGYDADASEVEVAFGEYTDKPGGTLEVRDNGHGMTLDDIRMRWMRISTDHKETRSLSPRFCRSRAGSKGIGRFAAETLGRRLVLSSTISGSRERVVVLFNWDEEYTAGTNLTTIGNPYFIEPADEREHGTLLRVEGLHSGWTVEDLGRVQKAVLLLQPPFPVTEVVPVSPGQDGCELDQGFAVKLTWKGQSESVEKAGLRDFLDAATATIEGRVDEVGKGSWRVVSERLELDESQRVPDLLLSTGPFTFRAHYFIYRANVIGSIAVNAARKMGREYGGVRLYRDGLRVPPYGEQKNDWLGLDELYRARSKVLAPIGNNNFFGQVFISRDENVLLVDTASREGVIENAAFQELRSFVSNGLVWGAQRVDVTRRSSEWTEDEGPATPTRTNLVSRAAAAGRSAANSGNIPETPTEEELAVMQEAEQADQNEERATEALLGEIELFQILASLGTSVAVFSHEVRGALNAATGALTDVEDEVLESKLEPEESLLESLGQARQRMEQLRELSDFINAYVSQSRRRSRAPQPMSQVVGAFLQAYEKTLNRRGARVQRSIEPLHLRTSHMARSELEAVLFNFLTNSLKAIDREGQQQRLIDVTVRQDNGEVVMKFQDNGRGIDNSIKDKVFEPFVTTSNPKGDELGAGTGLGLKIVRDIAEANGGSVHLGTPDEGYTTCMELRLPIWVPDANSTENTE